MSVTIPSYRLTIPARLAAKIARTLGFETIEVRNIDSDDFRDVSIASVNAALEAAYLAGFRAGQDRK